MRLHTLSITATANGVRLLMDGEELRGVRSLRMEMDGSLRGADVVRVEMEVYVNMEVNLDVERVEYRTEVCK